MRCLMAGRRCPSHAAEHPTVYGKAYGRTTALLMATASAQLPTPIHE